MKPRDFCLLEFQTNMKGGYQRAPGWGISETLLARSPALSGREIAGLTAVGPRLVSWIQPIRSCYVFFHFLPLSSTSPSNTQRSRLRKQYKLNNNHTKGSFQFILESQAPPCPFEMLTPAFVCQECTPTSFPPPPLHSLRPSIILQASLKIPFLLET